MARVIIMAGDKGGAGKTIAARLLVEMLTGAGKTLNLIDCNPSNPDLLEAFRGRDIHCSTFNIGDPNEIDSLFTHIVSTPPETVTVVDLPPGVVSHLAREAEIFSALAAEVGTALDVVWIMTTKTSCVRQLAGLAHAFEKVHTRYTVLKNLFYADSSCGFESFKTWNKSNLRITLNDGQGSVDAELPIADERLLQEAARHSGAQIAAQLIPECSAENSGRWNDLLRVVERNLGHLKQPKTQ